MRPFLTSLLLLIATAALAAEPTSTDNAFPVDPAVHALDGVTSRMTAYLKAVPTFHVESQTQWALDGTRTQTGKAHYRLGVQHPNAFRLEIVSQSDDRPSFVCSSDGKRLTRFYDNGQLAVFSRQDGGLDQLLEDAMTDSSLKGSGLDLLVRPDAHHYIMASASEIKDCGVEELRGRRSHHFSAAWFGGSRVDFWIAADHEPVLLRWRRTLTMDISGQSHELQVDSELTWKLDREFSPDQTEIEMPPEAIEVTDLQSYLLKGGTDKLLGSPAPAVTLKLLDGTEWDLAKHRGESLVVLFFFATWAAPSTQDMPALLAFLKEYEDRGVAFYAVAVGEAPQTVRDYVAAQNYTHPVVLDPEQKAAAAFRVTSLPVTILIDKDGTLQSVHVGNAPEDRALIRQDLGRLIEGKQLVEPQR